MGSFADVGKTLVIMLPCLHGSQTGPCGSSRVSGTTARERLYSGLCLIFTCKRKRRAPSHGCGRVRSQKSQGSCLPATLGKRRNYIWGRAKHSKATFPCSNHFYPQQPYCSQPGRLCGRMLCSLERILLCRGATVAFSTLHRPG